MKNKYNKLTCLFGHHQYSKKLTKDREKRLIYLCKICERSGYYEWGGSIKTWYDYDKEGNCVHIKWSNGAERWYRYDEKGYMIHLKFSDGEEIWVDNNGNWVNKKPKNWKHEKQIQ